MLKKHLAVMLLLFMAVGAFSQSIPSGTGRYEALGNSPFILDAATDINNNPAWNTQYRNYAFGDIGRGIDNDFQLSNQYAGATFGLGKKLNLGMVLNKRDDLWGLFGRPDSTQPIVPFKGLIGYSASKNLHIGLAPYIALWSSSTTHTDTNVTVFDASSNTFGGTLGFIYMIKKGWIEGALRFGMNSYKMEITSPIVPPRTQTVTEENDGGIEFGANFRAWILPKTNSKIAIVPLIGFSTYSWNPKVNSTEGVKYSYLWLKAGVGINVPVLDDIQIAGGLVGEYNTYKEELGSVENTRNELIAPRFHFAGETRIADWLTARFGYNRSIVSRSSENKDSVVTSEYKVLFGSDPVQTISLGAGFHFGRFSIDATVSEKWLKEGINFVSGSDTDLFGVISASYNFNN